MISFICESMSRSWTDKSKTLGKLSKHQSPWWKHCAVEEYHDSWLKPNVWEIYDSKTVISTLQISAVLDYGKIYFRGICKGTKIKESFYYI